ncbi:penicillin-binding transpeptidase domain-containing protein [Paraconexibacter antarcticus]|uniref:Penicillin-binding transpeptidase domain-containing protein n=1 Tax=Paraconexibacter antarcticus TaxID=2949664 RepID=A0ABY5DVD8_9ACTN|nr:penicillin-binding transpeptidase domain-containing protein [Paraconexibacter antarcticus]UTI65455.1 penicillin-binding transpeptidase domain-containing protein [Paraconexibacter antarcticus]
MLRRGPRSSVPPARTSLLPGGGARHRRPGRGTSFRPPRERRLPGGPLLLVLLLLAGAGAGAYVLLRAHTADTSRRDAATRFVRAWDREDYAAMWRATSTSSRTAHHLRGFEEAYRAAAKAAGVTRVRTGALGRTKDGAAPVPVVVTTKRFGTLRGVVRLPLEGRGKDAGVRWDASLRLPGLRHGEAVKLRHGAPPTRGKIFAADDSPLDADTLGASIAGTVGPPATGLQRLYADRLGGAPSQRLLFGDREIRKIAAVPGQNLHTTIRPALQRAAAAALGGRLGGVAVIRPRNGAVLAVAGIAVSAPQPPGSTFKIITLSTALQKGIASPSSSYPVRTFAVLSGTKLRNASNEACGGSLTNAFAVSCNSVFAPLGARLGAKTLVASARRFGFGETPKIPAIKPSTIADAKDLRDDLAVGAAAIGQERDLATPLEMATVGATIGAGGVRARPHLGRRDPVVRKRVIGERVAHQVRAMMLQVVRSGTGTAAALPGVEVAGKTGTAELRPTADGTPDPKNTDAWFVAFAPANDPKVAVAVMLVGAGQGGASAAPIARKVLAAALG